MTEERKTAARDEINAQINDGADQYGQRREDGCRRRCGFFASVSHMFAGLRDGLFLSMPFDPDAVFPQAHTGWVMSAYDLKTLEKTVRRKIWRTAVITPTENQLLKYFDHVATARNAGAVMFYTQGDSIIAMAVMISSEALRAAKQGEQTGREKSKRALCAN